MIAIGRWLLALAMLALIARGSAASAEDGYDLWLRYRPLPIDARAALVRSMRTVTVPASPSATITAAAQEVRRGLRGLEATDDIALRTGDGIARTVLIGTPASMPTLRELDVPLGGLGDEGYLVRTVTVGGGSAIVVAGNTDIGALYGAFALLRHLQTGGDPEHVDLGSTPKVKLRVLDHWDDLDRYVERGYAGQSIWDWWRLPAYKDPRYTDYARANASIGINGSVLNNVNASADSLTPRYIAKAAAVAAVLRPYGIRVYLSARFTAPIELGGLKTADPLDPAVRDWWAAKADEIYRAIPDFGGFLVKANSEGQPGPRDYHRTHADGANMLAAALAPHGGVVMWRAFVYAQEDAADRAKQAFAEFTPLDGKFSANVLLQVKNGPIDFQPREPFHPLFGGMPKTPLMIEFQITKEYLGFATHLVYLGPLFEETLAADIDGGGTQLASVVDGRHDGHRLTGMAGVANIGSDRDWTGSTFNQANWYAFGRMAWNPNASARAIATEWARMTFTTDPAFIAPTVDMMMASRQAAVDYMTPLGLAHQMATGHHYGPGPWIADLARPEWNPVYYNRADATGIGFDRTASGSDAVAQYAPRVARRFAGMDSVGEDLLWFHHVAWDHRMPAGGTLWDMLVHRYDRGVATVDRMNETWDRLRGFVDHERAAQTAAFLAVQADEARWWRDASIAYWQSLNHLPLPAGSPPPAHPLAWYEALRFPHAPGN
jgi:alpha-glucuronidase